MKTVPALPFDRDLGYPQQQQVRIQDVAYTIYYRWNPEDSGFAILKMVRIEDQAVILNSRLAELTPLQVRDLFTYQNICVLFPYVVTSSNCDVWVYYD